MSYREGTPKEEGRRDGMMLKMIVLVCPKRMQRIREERKLKGNPSFTWKVTTKLVCGMYLYS